MPLTAQEYLDRERLAETKSEYFRGEAIARPNASPSHALLSSRLTYYLVGHLRHSDCAAAANDLRVWMPAGNSFAYPDFLVTCGQYRFYDAIGDVVTNPKLIIEIFSPATEAHDRKTKFNAYKSIPSFEQYVLMSQEEPYAEVFTRSPQGFWVYDSCDGLESQLNLSAISFSVPLSSIYSALDFLARSQ